MDFCENDNDTHTGLLSETSTSAILFRNIPDKFII